MSNDAANQLMMFSAEALTTALLLLGLFRMRSRLGLSPLYVTLGVFQPIQVLLASSIYVEILPGLVISPGSVIMFTASLFAVLLVYIREDAIEARKVIYGIMAANLTMTLLLLVFGVQLGFPDTLNFLGLPREIFNQEARVMLAGTIALFGDVILVIFVYEAVRRFIPRVPFLRIYLAMAIILTFDTLVFATGAFYGQPNYGSILLAGIVGKVGMAAFYAAALTIYLRFMEPSDRVGSAAARPFRDIFYALTYREKYEIERDRAEEALRESEERFQVIFEQAAVGMAQIVSKTGQFIRINQTYCDIVGYTREEMEQRTFQEITHPDDLQEDLDNMQLLLEGKIREFSMEKRYYHKDRSIVWVLLTVSPMWEVGEEPNYHIAVVEDITERMWAEEALRNSKARLQSIFRVAPTGIGVVIERVIVEVNERFCEIMGYHRDELIGLEAHALYPTLEEYEYVGRVKYAQIQEHGTGTVETRLQRKDGQVIDVLLSSTPLDPGDLSGGVTFTALDITERVRADEELRKHREHLEELVAERTAELNERVAEMEGLNRAMTNLLGDLQAAHRKLAETGQKLQRTNKELETFTYSVSHDLKAPLRGIDGYSRLLLQDYADQLDEEGRAFLHTIRRATGQMNQLIEDLLAYSHLERRALVRGQVNPRAVVEALVAEYVEGIRERGASLTVELPCQAVTAETEGLTQALRNLLDNALKFTRDVSEPRIEIGGRKTENSCIMWVRDNGIGFDMQYHDRIFEIFQRLHRAEEYPGTGVGLAIVRKAVERMGGRVWAESALGEGATFYLEIPR